MGNMGVVYSKSPILVSSYQQFPYNPNTLLVINTNMNIDIVKLEKLLKDQAKQIDSLKKAVSVMARQLNAVSLKTNRAYESGRKNTNSINSLTDTLRRNSQ